ncbi:hypothetical protein BDZ85DRAFT_45374 [Elsinoe ampelina]|uniref:Uncharacterized protein n=1 Tax=Elsinoe ampelina TaxID=302913 RepID=A0A6A6G130_9PEZI|nr:hypothetical protein BDZ85DRAFT_45374 [Elsinoe ampelina]
MMTMDELKTLAPEQQVVVLKREPYRRQELFRQEFRALHDKHFESKKEDKAERHVEWQTRMVGNQRYEKLLEEQEAKHRLQMQEQVRSKGEIIKDLVTLVKRLTPQLRATRPETVQSEVVYDDIDKSLEEIERRINAAMEYEADQDDESTEDYGTPHGGRPYQLQHQGGSHRRFHVRQNPLPIRPAPVQVSSHIN